MQINLSQYMNKTSNTNVTLMITVMMDINMNSKASMIHIAYLYQQGN